MQIKRFSPRNEVIMVLRDEQAHDVKTDAGIFLPNRAVELANEGVVRAVGPNSQYQVDQRVVFTKYAGSELPLNGVTYLLLKEKEVQGVIEATEVDGPVGDTGAATTENLDAAVQEALGKLEKTATGYTSPLAAE